MSLLVFLLLYETTFPFAVRTKEMIWPRKFLPKMLMRCKSAVKHIVYLENNPIFVNLAIILKLSKLVIRNFSHGLPSSDSSLSRSLPYNWPSRNLLVIVTIILESRFYVMRYILLASLALSDFLLLVLVNSFRIGSIAKEHWLYGQTMCFLNTSFARYFYINTVLHLVAVSYDRYLAIVKSPLTYNGIITNTRVVFLALIWIVPVIPVSILG